MNEDIIPQNKNDLKEIEKLTQKDLSKMSEDKIREKIFNSYYFIVDFFSSTKEEVPKGWFDSRKNPENSLWTGFPPDLKRQPLKIHFPSYNLTRLAYFTSEDPYVSRLNICQGFWQQNRLQMAYDCFFFLQMDLAKDGVAISSLVRLQVNILHAFFFLYLATNEESQLLVWNAKTVPPSTQAYTEGDHYSMARVLFSYIATKVDDSVFMPKEKVDVIEPIYKEILNSPVYFKLSNKISNKKTSVTLLKDPIDTLKWIQTVMPIVYANAMTMNQGIMIWDRAFTSAYKIENYFQYFNYPQMPEESPLVVNKHINTESEIYIAPKNNTDLVAAADLFRANAMIIARDPGKALEYVSAGIFRKAHPEISALLFDISANAYFDLDLLRWARRSYSWAELYSKSFASKVPSSLLYGAESAYWSGNYDVAKNGYERFIKLIGDPKYAPWANLRLAEIAERKGENERAKVIYEQILRKFYTHEVSNDAQVRLFCLYEKKLTKNTKRVEYEKVMEKIKNARDVLKKQAKTCMLRADLTNMQDDSFKDSKLNVIQKSEMQKKAIQSYAKEFPDSEFLVLFTDRLKELELAEGTFLTSKNSCNKLIDFYSKNRKSLNKLAKSNHKYVNGLKWDSEDRLKLLRCSAFIGNISLWNELRKSEIGQDGEPLQSYFYNLSIRPSVEVALTTYLTLKKSSKSWVSKIKKIEKSSFEVTKADDFWEMLTLRELMKFDLLMSKSSENLFNNAVSQDFFKDPKLIYSSNTFCFWMLRASHQFSNNRWESIAQTKDKSIWLLLNTNLKEQKASPCESSFAKALFNVALTRPTPYLDQNILLPYLENRGFAVGSEDWLHYVQRIEKERGYQDKEVQDIYRKLLKEGKEPLVKEAAGMWIKKNLPEEADKLLW
ncbi:tetratricopeptide repeat protein [Silvanigrella aquatica]|nr:hypothetical protein [Silvanigrella aquatica]